MAPSTPVRRKGGGKKTADVASIARSPAAATKSASSKKATSKKPKKGKPAKDKKAAKVSKKRYADPTLFSPLSEGERADALRVLTEDKRLANMAKVGRYRVIAVEPYATKPPNPLAGRRVARVVAYDYASDRSVEATVDLDSSEVAVLNISRSQPMLAIEEEDAAIAIAVDSDEVQGRLTLGDEPLSAMHYWGTREAELSFSHRSAAVIFGRPGSRPSLVVIVDLLASRVAEIVPAEVW